jgi:tetratricopeptide (TPR) repeat protein
MGTMGKWTVVCIFMVLALAGVEDARGSPATPALIAEVLAALDRGDAQNAARLADAALGEEGVSTGQQASLILYRGLARELLGDGDSALQDFTHALDRNTLSADEREQALLQRGFLRDALEKWNEAASDYSAVIALKGAKVATALNNRANIYRRQGKLGPARRDYLAALTAGSGRAQYSYFGLGQIAETQHDLKAARDFYLKAASIDPNYAAAAERLTALGAPPTGFVFPPDDDVILHPPPGAKMRPSHGAVAPGFFRKTNFETATQLMLRPALDRSGAALPHPSGGGEIQLGAWRSEAQASAGWNQAVAKAGTMLDGLSPRIIAVDLPGKGRFFRLRINLRVGDSGGEICASLVAKGVTCLPVLR